MAMKKLNHIFKIDKQLTSENKKPSNAFIPSTSSSQEQSFNKKEQQPQRKAITFDNVPLIGKKLDTSVDEDESDDGALLQTRTLQQIPEEEYGNDGHSAKQSESTIQKQQYLKLQRMESQESFEQNSMSRRHTQQVKQQNYFKQNEPQVILNKSISKSSIEQKSELSSKEYQQNDNQEILNLFHPSKKTLDDNKRDTEYTSSSNVLSSQNQLVHQQSTLLSGNFKIKPQYASRQSQISQISQKTVPNQYSRSSQQQPATYGTALNTCKSLSGDIFTLRPGYRVLVLKVDKEKKLIHCSYQNMSGLFYLRDIAVIEGDSPKDIPTKSRTPSYFEVKYKELLNDRFNTRSKSPNYGSTKTRPFMRF